MRDQEIIFRLIRSAIDGQPPYLGTQPVGASQWWTLFRLAQRGHVAALTSLAIVDMDIPRDVKIPWLAECEKAGSWYRYQLGVQEEVEKVMNRHLVDTLVLKGTHLAQYYPQPELREFGDIDLYFYSRHDEADEIAHRELGVTIHNDSQHHTKYDLRGVTVESHYDFLNRYYPRSNGRLEASLKKMAPSANFEVLFLMRHMAGHFAASGITLRDITDFYLTCRTLHGDVNWPVVQDMVNRSGMAPFAAALCTIIERRFEYRVPLTFPVYIIGNDTAENVEHEIVYGSRYSDDREADGLARLTWKVRRWFANRWKRRMVYTDSELSLLVASLTSHLAKPRSILHKM